MEAQVCLADPEQGMLDDVVDLDAYPVDRAGSHAWDELVTAARAQLDGGGCAVFRRFLRPAALARARSELAGLAPKAIIRSRRSSVYARTDAERELPPDDPRRIESESTVGHLTRDQIPPDAVVARLYVAPAFKQLVAACLGERRVFEYADPLAGLVTTIVPPGGTICWHYDTNEFVVSLMTQQAEAGGVFRYCPSLRSPGDENLGGLGRVLRGEAPALIRALDLQPGDLQIFKGRYSLHQVSRVEGRLQRHVAILSYANRPGVIGPVDRTRAVYGRVTEAHLVARELAGAPPDGLIF